MSSVFSSCTRKVHELIVLQDILTDPDEIHGLRGNTIPRRLSVHYISFSAHVDYAQNSEFIELIKAQHVVSVSRTSLLCYSRELAGSRARRAK